jgi:hypothetical protein
MSQLSSLLEAGEVMGKFRSFSERRNTRFPGR